MVLGVKGLGLVQFQPNDPGAVVEDLRHHLAWGPVALELDDVQVAIGIHGEDIDELAVGSQHLAADDQDVQSQHRRVCDQHVLQAGFQIQRRVAQRYRAAVGHPPDRGLHGHRRSPRGPQSVAVAPALSWRNQRRQSPNSNRRSGGVRALPARINAARRQAATMRPAFLGPICGVSLTRCILP